MRFAGWPDELIMPTIFVENRPYEVKEGQNLLHACLSLGFNIPYFCWHPAMHSVGACRQCAVKLFKDEKDKRGRIVMSCMTAATEGTHISIDDPDVRKFRASVVEWLMLNHPHDCPVCDEGGECHLQDMTVMTGHVYRKTRFKKRTHRNQDLGPFINHEMNRCIQCYRCVRFYNDYAGGRDFSVFAAHDHVYFGRHDPGTLENEFSGNLIEICPTGVFTDKTLKRHYTRKWDLQTAPSVCVHCGLGCNTIPGERYGTLRRVLNRYNGEVNGYFLCDRGRFGYEFVNSGLRIRQPMAKAAESDERTAITGEEAVRRASALLYFGSKVIGIGSPRASLEANFALRSLVGEENFCTGMSDAEHELIEIVVDILRKGPARPPSLRDVSECDVIFILGADVTNEAPLLDLTLRQSVRNKPMEAVRRLHIPEWNDAAVREAMQNERGPLFILSFSATKLDEIAARTYQAAPDDIARLGCAVARELGGDPPDSVLSADENALVQEIAGALKDAKRPLILSGTGSGSAAVIKAAADAAQALCKEGRTAALCYTVAECNSIGLGLMGGKSIGESFGKVKEADVESVIILENDLYRRAEREKADAFLAEAKNVIVIDHLLNRTSAKADLLFPAATFAEADGTFINNEGRGQRFFQVFVPDGEIKESWRWLRDMMVASGRTDAEDWSGIDDVAGALAGMFPVFRPLRDAAPGADFRIAGQKIPRQPHRYSGRTAMRAHINVSEPKPPDDFDTPLSFSMEGYPGRPPSPLISRFWSPGWNSVQSVNKFQMEVGGRLTGGDPGVHLIEPSAGGSSYFADLPPAFERRERELLIVPLYHIFGSEELSVLSHGVLDRSPKPYLALNPNDAKAMGIARGDEIEMTVGGRAYRITAKHMESLPEGTAGFPAGIYGSDFISYPAWARVQSKEEERQ
jgi:NADH-quinone oxidoreductase subunit G